MPNEARPRRIAVVGGGVTGLAAAHRLIELSETLSSPVEVTLLEAGARIGGVAETRRIGDYLAECGPDMFITNQPAATDLCDRIGLTDELIPTDPTHRGSLVLRSGKPVPVPDGFMLLSPAKVWPVLTSPIFSPLGKLRMGLEFFIPKKTDASDETLATFVRRRFGREAFDRLIQPLVGGIYTADPEKLSLKATMPRFIEMERKHRSLIVASRKQADERNGEGSSGARYGLFTAPRNGMAQIYDRLHSIIRNRGQVRLQSRVTAISPDGIGGVRLVLESDEVCSFDGVVISVPPFRAASMLSTGSSDPAAANSKTSDELIRLLNSVEYSSAAVVVSGHRLQDIEHPLDAFGLVVPAIEKRRILAVSFASRKFPGRAPDDRVLIRTFVGGALQPEMLEESDDRISEIVQQELSDILGVAGTPDFSHVCRYERSMPQYHIGHSERMAAASRLIEELPGIELAGNAWSGVGIPDCIRSGESAALRIMQHLDDPTSGR